MKSSFLAEDVTLLLKDITGCIEALPTAERERRIQTGTHYSEMLPLEYRPSEEYICAYENALRVFGRSTAEAVMQVSDRIVRRKGKDVVIVSLVRAGTPVGVLISRYIRKKYGFACPHYSISIIRDRGIDRNAVNFILSRHKGKDIQFVDGWVGKGVIYKELRKVLKEFPGMDDRLAVLADPAGVTELCGTHEDIMIPSSCLNCTVSGLISRSVLREDLIRENDFHGAACYNELAEEDRTYEFIRSIEACFRFDLPVKKEDQGEVKENRKANLSEQSIEESPGMLEVERIRNLYGIGNVNFIKPGIGETTRVLLRRVPWKVLVDERFRNVTEMQHIFRLAEEKNVKIEIVHLEQYKCCGIIKQISDI